jgi:hypothetical protein
MSAAAASSSPFPASGLPHGRNPEQEALVREVLEPERTPVEQTQIGQWIDTFRLKLDGPIGAQRLQLRDYIDAVFGRNIGTARRGTLQGAVLHAAIQTAMLHPEEFDSRSDLLMDGDRQDDYWMAGVGFILATNTFISQAQSEFALNKYTEKDHRQLFLLKANVHYVVACVWSDSPECLPSYLAQCVENPLEARRLLQRTTVDFYNGLGVFERAARVPRAKVDYQHHFADICLFDDGTGRRPSQSSGGTLEIQLINGKQIFSRLAGWYDSIENLEAKSKKTTAKSQSKTFAWQLETQNIFAIHLMTQAVTQLTNLLWSRQKYREENLGAKRGESIVSNTTQELPMSSKWKLPDWAALSELYPHDSRTVVLNDLEATVRRIIGASHDDMVEASPRASPVTRPNARTPAVAFPERPAAAHLPLQYRPTGVRASGVASPAASPVFGVPTSSPPPPPSAAARTAPSPKSRRHVDIFSGATSASATATAAAAAAAAAAAPPRAGTMGIPSGKKLNRHGLASSSSVHKPPVAATSTAAAAATTAVVGQQASRAPTTAPAPAAVALLPARRRRIDESLVTESSGNILNSSDERPASDDDEGDRGDRTPDAPKDNDDDDDDDAAGADEDGDVNMSVKARSRTETTKKRRTSKKQRVASPSPQPGAAAGSSAASPVRSVVASRSQRPAPTAAGKTGDFASALRQKRAILTQLLKGDQQCVTGLLTALPHFRSADGSDASAMGMAAINQIIDELQRDPGLPASLISGAVKFEDYMRTRPSAPRK